MGWKSFSKWARGSTYIEGENFNKRNDSLTSIAYARSYGVANMAHSRKND
jgi:Tfp pilus assembly protein FimT